MSQNDEYLVAAERSAVAEEVASLVRHDLKNKLAAISNAATYLTRKLRDSEPWEEDPRIGLFLDLIRAETAKAKGLVSERLNLGEQLTTDKTPTSLGRMVTDLFETFSFSKDLDFNVDTADEQLVAMAPVEFALLLRCLVCNSIEAMPDSGVLTLRTEDLGDMVQLSVGDTGTGFDDPDAALRAFASTKVGHAGIGLNIARRITFRYGGRLTLSNRGADSLVQVTFPAHQS